MRYRECKVFRSQRQGRRKKEDRSRIFGPLKWPSFSTGHPNRKVSENSGYQIWNSCNNKSCVRNADLIWHVSNQIRRDIPVQLSTITIAWFKQVQDKRKILSDLFHRQNDLKVTDIDLLRKLTALHVIIAFTAASKLLNEYSSRCIDLKLRAWSCHALSFF